MLFTVGLGIGIYNNAGCICDGVRDRGPVSQQPGPTAGSALEAVEEFLQ